MMRKTPPLSCLTVTGIAASFAVVLLVLGFSFTRGGALFSPGELSAYTNGKVLGGVKSHAEITDCAKCHTSPLEKKTMGARCVDCHTNLTSDPNNFHNKMVLAQAAPRCTPCHLEHRGANAALTTVDQAAFPHGLVTFSLKAHVKNADGKPFQCSDCHDKNYSPVKASVCADCHDKIDTAFMQRHTAAYGSGCLACHDGLETYGKNFDHQKTQFILRGKHLTLECIACHAGETSIAAMKATPKECFSCHAKDDAHKGDLGQNCGQCHASISWKNAILDHSATSFALSGKHQGVACEDCHQNGVWRGTPKDCVSCHQKDDIHTGDLGKDCGSCHTPADWTQATIDHGVTGYPLTGKHLTAACAACHVDHKWKGLPKDCAACHQKDDVHGGDLGTDCARCHVTDDWAKATIDHNTTIFPLVGKHAAVACESCHANRQFKGLTTACSGCHAKDDAHKGAFGSDCGLCHTPVDWTKMIFDHNTAAFKLTGAHSGAACESCHVNGVLKGTPSTCSACHGKDDPHKGSLGSDCGQCHSTTNWTSVSFDHSKTNFPLSGRHGQVTCTSCHSSMVFNDAPTICYACHSKDDGHSGAFGTDCGLCHSTSGWSPSTFNHNTASFKLTGAHAGAACSKCHSGANFTSTPQNCSACHQDAHSGQFGNNCEQCHTTSAWSPSTFNHNNSGFPLTGRHAGVGCTQCHVGGNYTSTPQNCSACHQDAHSGQLGSQCDQCHSTSGWSPATFDHDKSGFPLDGKHASVSCTSCHANGNFSNLPTACSACHKDPHGGGLGSSCDQCHSPSGWSPANFDHGKFFQLDGAHAHLGCSSCHSGSNFSGAPTACGGCHADPAYHKGLFGGSCDSCHNTTSWAGADYKGAHTFPMDHGTARTCQNCHPSNLNTYTCFSCHSQNEMVSKHNEHGITDISNCVKCHPTGKSGD